MLNNTIKSIFYTAIAWLVFVAAATPALAAPGIQVSVAKSKETIKLSVGETSPREVFILENPDRLVVDVPVMPGVSSAQLKKLALPASYKGELLSAARAAYFDEKTLRFVFNLTRPVEVGRTGAKAGKGKGGTITIEIEPVSRKAFSRTTSNIAQEDSTDKSRADARGRGIPGAVKESKRKTPKPVIMIDPGHGGIDPGAIGPSGTEEKDIVLVYARALKARLSQSGKYTVKLTREGDRIVPLRGRIALARKAGASIFISLHADSAQEHDARGSSVYTLSETASDQETEALAAHENKADILAGINLTNEREDVADILISLAQRETNNRSATLADMLVMAMSGKVRLLPNTHRFAGFAVLKAPDVPSVLVEIGFLSHPQEEKLLKTKAHREQVVASLARGIDAYFEHKKKMEGED
jgi:N-acetylmuramoyl-L-alanine amidase